ncbi:MAG: mucoidy inhibitor MuiA family protein [Spirochaetia bacterium]|nr:mucoidy inhibitor MuiA family protein [Spirochaetia bacterium]
MLSKQVTLKTTLPSLLTGAILSVAVMIPLRADSPSENRNAFSPAVQAVTVYSDRALITRAASLHLPAGKTTLVFDAASPILDSASLRGFSNNPDCVVQGITSYTERRIETVNKELLVLEEQMDKLERENDAVQRRRDRAGVDMKGVEQYAAFLSRVVSDQSTQTHSKESSPASWDDALQFLSERRMSARRQLQQADEEAAALSERMGILRGEIERIRSASRKTVRIVEITVQTDRASEAEIGFSYIITGASWNVSYGMYLEKDGSLGVEYYGNITQRTGEDWKITSLNLSTSRPSFGAERPPLTPLVIRARQAQTRQVIVQEEKQAEEETGHTEATPESNETDGFAKIDESGSALIFQIRKPSDIPSGERSQRVVIARFTEKPKDVHYRVVPPVRHSAHLAMWVPNSRSFPLLAGPVDIYKSSGFTGHSAIRYWPAGSPVLVGFGPDPTVRVSRQVLNYKESGGIISSAKVSRVEVLVQLENQSDETRQVSVFERMPVSELEEIKVKVQDKTMQGYVEEKKGSGILRWNLTLKPREKSSVTLIYTVSVGSGLNVDIRAE